MTDKGCITVVDTRRGSLVTDARRSCPAVTRCGNLCVPMMRAHARTLDRDTNPVANTRRGSLVANTNRSTILVTDALEHQ